MCLKTICGSKNGKLWYLANQKPSNMRIFHLFLLFIFSNFHLAAQISRFDNDSEKWYANEDAIGNIVHFDPDFGNPPPSIYAEDSNTGKPWYFVAPDCFRGNRAYAYGDSLKYDFFCDEIGSTPYTNDIQIVGGNGMRIVQNLTFLPTPGAWTHFGVRLIESDWHVGDFSGANPTQAEFVQVLQNIADLEIRGEYLTGYDKAWIDNVWLSDVPDTTVFAEICAGEKFQVGKYTHSTQGAFLDELEDLNGCDSLLVTLVLTVHPKKTSFESKFICEGEKITLPDGSETEISGSWIFKNQTTEGCDSTTFFEVKMFENRSVELAPKICRGEKYALPDGSETAAPGIYSFDLQTFTGCDSLVKIELSVFDTARIESSAVICGGEKFILADGSEVEKPGLHEVIFQTWHGCDSTVAVELEVLDSSLQIFRKNRCTASPFLLPDGKWVDSTGIYIFNWKNENGCDSTLVFDLKFHPQADTVLEVILPEGEVYVLPDGDEIRDSSLEKTWVFQTDFGCDSIVTLRLKYIFYHVFVPNAFSPDGDGVNEFFTLFTNDNALEIKTLNVYDRWGEHLFLGQNLPPNLESRGWDGTFRGEKMMPGVYVFTAEILFEDGAVRVFSGDVNLVR